MAHLGLLQSLDHLQLALRQLWLHAMLSSQAGTQEASQRKPCFLMHKPLIKEGTDGLWRGNFSWRRWWSWWGGEVMPISAAHTERTNVKWMQMHNIWTCQQQHQKQMNSGFSAPLMGWLLLFVIWLFLLSGHWNSSPLPVQSWIGLAMPLCSCGCSTSWIACQCLASFWLWQTMPWQSPLRSNQSLIHCCSESVTVPALHPLTCCQLLCCWETLNGDSSMKLKICHKTATLGCHWSTLTLEMLFSTHLYLQTLFYICMFNKWLCIMLWCLKSWNR